MNGEAGKGDGIRENFKPFEYDQCWNRSHGVCKGCPHYKGDKSLPKQHCKLKRCIK